VRFPGKLCLVTAALAAALLDVAPAQGQFFRRLATGLSFLAGPTAPSGTRSGQFVLSYEPLQRGWRAEWNRTFGQDAFGRPNSIDLGVADLTLTGGNLRVSAQHFTRFMKGVELFVNTPTPISYSMSLNTGFQDASATGVISINEALGINQFGFYDLNLTISNRGNFNTDGFAVVDENATLDFDVGPISVSGNIFADVLAAVTEPLFAGVGVQNPFAKFSGRATKEALVAAPIEQVRSRVERGEVISQEEMEAVVNATLLASILGVTTPDLEFLQDAQVAAFSAQEAGALVAPGGGFAAPEPATMVLLGLPLAILFWRRSRRRPATR